MPSSDKRPDKPLHHDTRARSGARRRHVRGRRSLAEARPDLIAYLNVRASNFEARDVASMSGRVAVWTCSRCDDQHHKKICDVVRGREYGPMCKQCVAEVRRERRSRVMHPWGPLKEEAPGLHAELITLLDPPEGTTVDNVTAGSGVRGLWRCGTCGRESEARVQVRFTARRAGRSGCKPCKNRARGSLQTVRPDLAAELLPEESGVAAADLAVYDRRSVWWRCRVCTYQWETQVASRSYGTRCPECAPRGWTKRRLLAALSARRGDFSRSRSAADRRAFFARIGVLSSTGVARTLAEAIIVGDLPKRSVLEWIDSGVMPARIERCAASHVPGRFAKKPIPAGLRAAVIDCDGYACRACGAEDTLAVDHFIPEHVGGLTEFWNLQTLCRVCNSIKSTKPMTLNEIRRIRRDRGLPVLRRPILGEERLQRAILGYEYPGMSELLVIYQLEMLLDADDPGWESHEDLHDAGATYAPEPTWLLERIESLERDQR